MSRVTGLGTILRNFRIYSERLKNDLIFEVDKTTKDIEVKAKNRVPVNTGKLKQSIFSRMDFSKGIGTVGATEKYAPYIEFGTGGRVNIPNGYSGFANQFRGRGKRNVNMRPRPYLIPSFLEETANLKVNTQKVLSKYSGLKSIRRL